tara:strand:+ start:1254 stop:2258 length:1005 start_codon:yes stop_codon:yes gene_type:complete
MNIVSYNCSHNAAVCYLKDGKIEWMIEEERVSRKKHDHRPYISLVDTVRKVDDIEIALYTTLHHSDDPELSDRVFNFTCELIQKVKDKPKLMDCSDEHHLHHASLGFYNSGFEEAAVLVVDGAGAYVEGGGHEVETIYKASYPHTFDKVHQRAVPWYKGSTMTDYTIGIGFVYAGISEYLGFGTLDCGKLMGLSSYGKEDPNIKSFLIDGEVDETLWERDPNGVKFKPYGDVSPANLAWRCQKDFETYMIALIKKALEVSNNIVLSGGCALNCVANYEYLKHLPEGAKLYVEPVSSDAGTAAGLAMYGWRNLTKSTEIYPIKDLYWGPQHEILL